VAERTPPIFAWLGGLTVLAVVAGGGWVTWEATRPRLQAPNELNVCWRLETDGGQVRFIPQSRRTPNLESCAATLEGLYLDNGRPLRGAFQGRFIFVDAEAIQSAETLDGARWRIFYGDQREGLDMKIRAARKRAASGMKPMPQGRIVVE
jgi:hypothetical protein